MWPCVRIAIALWGILDISKSSDRLSPLIHIALIQFLLMITQKHILRELILMEILLTIRQCCFMALYVNAYLHSLTLLQAFCLHEFTTSLTLFIELTIITNAAREHFDNFMTTCLSGHTSYYLIYIYIYIHIYILY